MTVRACEELVEAASLDPLDGANAAVSDSGELAAENDVVHAAVPLDPVTVIGWLAQPGIVVPLAENATVPAGATEPAETVAVSVTV